MPLTFEQFKQLREKGLSPQQIADFESGYVPEETSKTKKPLPGTVLDRVAGFSEKTFGKASQFMFGTTGKTAGGLIARGISGAMKLSPSEKMQKKGVEIEKKLEDTTKTDIAFTMLELYPGGGFVGKALKKLPGGSTIAKNLSKLPEKSKVKAIKLYSEAFGATTEKLKTKTAKVVPELLKRGEKISTLEKFGEKAGGLMDEARDAIKVIENKLPKEKMTYTKPLISSLKSIINKNISGGKIVNQEATNATLKVMKTITQYGDTISTKDLIKVRRILDKSVAIANRDFTKSTGLTLKAEAQTKLVNSIRRELAKDVPELAKVNKEFTLWANVKQIVDATVKRRTSQTGGLTKTIVGSAGIGAGLMSGDSLADKFQNAFIFGVLGRNFVKLVQSARWKTLSATTRYKIANYLASGQFQKAELLIIKLSAGAKNILTEE
ncbi:MAG: hypothetical protein U9P90_02465 [Patescibacteria group bacterium]|nr:hypothetical protein [Patescibacteria group bacterium]